VKQRITTLVASGLLALALFGAATAGPLEDGVAAYQRDDFATAMRIWRPLADQGDAVAQNNLGVMYANGQGVPQDYAQALIWTRKAANQGDAVAQNNLGVMYRDGEGVALDYAQAMIWFRKAADQGDAVAQNNLGGIYYVRAYCRTSSGPICGSTWQSPAQKMPKLASKRPRTARYWLLR